MLVAGCVGRRRVAGPVVDRDTGLRRLGTAITSFDAARATVLRTTAAQGQVSDRERAAVVAADTAPSSLRSAG